MGSDSAESDSDMEKNHPLKAVLQSCLREDEDEARGVKNSQTKFVVHRYGCVVSGPERRSRSQTLKREMNNLTNGML